MATKISPSEYLAEVSPPWIGGTWGQRWISALGGTANDLSSWVKVGVKQRFVLNCYVDALKYHGLERVIERIPWETDDAYRVRLWGAWYTWIWSGTDVGIYRGFETLGWTIAPYLGEPWGTWFLGPSWPEEGHVWTVNVGDVGLASCPDGDADPTHWARFWIALDGYAEGYIATAQVIGDGSLIGEGYAIGLQSTTSTKIADEVYRWVRVVRKWKGSHTTCPSMFIILSSGGWGDIIGPFALIGGGATIGGTVEEITVGEKP